MGGSHSSSLGGLVTASADDDAWKEDLAQFFEAMEAAGQRFQIVTENEAGRVLYFICDPVKKTASEQYKPEPGLPTWPPDQSN